MDFYFYDDIAYSFRNIKKEVDFLEKIFKKYSDVKVKKILDVGCGTGEHAIELVKRGYKVCAIDIDKDAIKYLSSKFRHKNLETKVLDATKIDRLNKKFDAAISLGFVFSYLVNFEKQLEHLVKISKILKKGSIYVLELPTAKGFLIKSTLLDEWEEEKNGIKVKVEYKTRKINWLNFIVESDYILKANSKTFRRKEIFRILSLEEIKAITAATKKFKIIKFIGSFKNVKLENANEIIAILKRV